MFLRNFNSLCGSPNFFSQYVISISVPVELCINKYFSKTVYQYAISICALVEPYINMCFSKTVYQYAISIAQSVWVASEP